MLSYVDLLLNIIENLFFVSELYMMSRQTDTSNIVEDMLKSLQ